LLPWLAIEYEAADHHVAAQTAALDTSEASPASPRDDDASDIPGSPTHPADHHCLQCEVLKHLSRCVLAPLDAAEVPLPAGCPVQPRAGAESQYIGYTAVLPPVRAPPLRNA
jgi:hypothetical protein